MSNFRRYYQNNNIVFITIATYNRNPLLTENISLARNAFKAVKYEYKIIAGIVLPEHIHLLLQCLVKQGYYEKNWCNFEDKNNILCFDLE